MANKRRLRSTDLALATFIMPNLGSLCHPNSLEEASVAHRPDPRQHQQIQKFLREVILSDALYDPTKFKPDWSSHI